MKFRKQSLVTLSIIVFYSIFSLAAFASSDDVDNVETSLKFDKKRQVFYTGCNISDVKGNIESPKPYHSDENIIVFNTGIIDRKQNILGLSNHQNNYFYSVDLLEKYNGLPLRGKIDRRSKVSSENIEKHPYNNNGKLECVFQSNDAIYTIIGSGTLIGKKTIITAAHNIYDYEKKLVAKEVYFYPSRNGEHSLTSLVGEGIYNIIHPGYFYNETSDIGAVILDKHFECEDKIIRSIPIKLFDPEELKGKKVQICGYPGGIIEDSKIVFLNGNYMVSMIGYVINISERRIYYDIDTSAGQSGSGIFINIDDSYFCCGVHIRGGNQEYGNIGTFLDEGYFKTVNRWLERYDS